MAGTVRIGCRSRRICRVAVAMAVAAMMGLAGCTSPERAQPIEELRMGLQPWIGYSPWFIAQKQGFFAKQGLNVRITNFEMDADRNSALAAGLTDVGNLPTDGIIALLDKKKDSVTPLLLVDASVGADAVLSVPEITTAQQLVGNPVAYESGTTSELLLHHLLMTNNIPFTKVRHLEAPAADAGTLLIRKRVPAAVTYEPYISEALKGHEAQAHVLYGSDQAPRLISDFLVANRSWLQSHGAAARALIAAWDDAIGYLHSHPTEAVAIMAEALGTDPEALRASLPGVKLYTVAENRQLVDSGELAQTYREVGATLKAMGRVSSPTELSATTDFSYLR